MCGKQGRDEFSCRDARSSKMDRWRPAAVLGNDEEKQNREDAYCLLDQLADCRQSCFLQTEIIAADAAVYSGAREGVRYDHQQICTPLVAEK